MTRPAKIILIIIAMVAATNLFRMGEEAKNPTLTGVGAFSMVACLYFLARAILSRGGGRDARRARDERK
ncbi:MAG: hypothetical protein ABIP55_04785 [Tepidisphaeraceae bacterium]